MTGVELIELWPSAFLEQSLPAHESATRHLETLAGTHAGESVFAIEDEHVGWLKANIIHGMSAFLRAGGFPHPVPCGASGWFDIQRMDDVRGLRNRPGAYLAGLYVVTSPDADADVGSREDRRPGCITFYDPRVGMNMNSIRRDPYALYHHTMALTPGSLLMWPAYVNYFLHPTHAHEPAIRVAFDVHLQSAPPGE